MRPALTCLIAAAMAASAAPAALAQAKTAAPASPALRNDVRCLLVLQAVARDPKQRESATRGVFYYLGRIDARGGVDRVEPVLLAEGKAINSPQIAQADLNRCGAELTARSVVLQNTNQRLVKDVKATLPPGAAAAAKPAGK